ncbi:MAG: site-specific integrase [bacterium]|nr:site-specific integrase [bacterium]
MATIRKRKHKYEVQIRRRGFAPISRSFHRHADAEEWARFMETQADRGELPTPMKVLDQHKVKDLLIRYRDEISAKKRSYYSEKYALDFLIRQPFANLSLAELTAAKICDYRDARLKQVKPGTVRRDLAILKHTFDMAEREWNIPMRENPLNKIAKVKPQAGRSRRLSGDEFKALQAALAQTKNPYVMPIIKFAIATGMRRGEILQVKWIDVDFHAKTLHIPVTKNGHPRTIPLSSEALSVLHEETERTECKNKLVFPLTGNGFQQAWERLRNRAGLKDLHFHDLRHEAISRFVERGLSVPEVALISGHRDYRMLFRYTHLKPESLVDKLG